jgi:hypothetical protein
MQPVSERAQGLDRRQGLRDSILQALGAHGIFALTRNFDTIKARGRRAVAQFFQT